MYLWKVYAGCVQMGFDQTGYRVYWKNVTAEDQSDDNTIRESLQSLLKFQLILKKYLGKNVKPGNLM